MRGVDNGESEPPVALPGRQNQDLFLESELFGLKDKNSALEGKVDDALSGIQNLLSQMEEMKRQFARVSGISQHPWRMTGTSIHHLQEVQTSQLRTDYVRKMFKLPKDIFSIVAVYDRQSLPFWWSIFIVLGIQLFLIILLLWDQVCPEDCENFLGMPANAEISVRIAQGLALLIALMSQRDLLLGIEGFCDGAPELYNGDACLSMMTQKQWRSAYFLRFLEGILGFVASCVLLLQSESVFDVLLNFLGVQFIADIDNLAFQLGQRGYFGKRFQVSVEKVESASFLYEERHPRNSSSSSKPKQYGHILAVMGLLLISIFVLGYLSVISDAGKFSVSDITVEFGDEVLPYLGTYNGCYQVSVSDARNRRPIYQQRGYELDGGKFAFCSTIETLDEDEIEGWVFFVGSIDNDPCTLGGYILRSSRSESFNLLEVAALQEWYTKEGLPIESALFLEIQAEDTTGHCGYNAFLESKTACSELYVNGDFIDRVGATSQLFEKLASKSVLADPQVLDATLSHPIYYGSSSSELVLFTGRRWVLTDIELLEPKGVLTNTSGWDAETLQTYFYSDRLFRTFLRGKDVDWVLLISEPIETATDPLTPIGLQWYSPRYENNSSFAFPFADLARPRTGNLACNICDDSTNPCFFDGICQPDGTCECVDRTSGFLCREIPIGDGVCDERFNTIEYNYDGGDCCASTCIGPLCGNNLDIVFGIDLREGEFWSQYPDEGAAIVGFDKCKDPAMETFTIELVPIKEIYDGILHGEDCGLESVTVICDGVIYLQTPNIYTGESVDEVEKCHEGSDGLVQSIHVPKGVACELSRPLNNFEWFYEMLLFRGNGTDSTTIQEGNNGTASLLWNVPSTCLQDAFTEYLGDLGANRLYDITGPYGDVVQQITEDDTSVILCSYNHSLVMERYALAVFNNSVGLKSAIWVGHQCNGLGSGGIEIMCNDFDKIVKLEVGSWSMNGGSIPSELFLLSDLTHLRLTGSGYDCDGQRGELIGTLPTEIGLLKSLTHLELYRTCITGTIPSEIGNLKNVSYLDLSETSMFGTMPSEIGNLGKLSFLDLKRTDVFGPMPTEIGNLSILSILDLSDSEVSGSIPTTFGKLRSLSRFDGRGTQIGGQLPSEIGELRKLESLEFYGLQFTGTLPSEIGDMSSLSSVFLGENLISGTIPSEIGLLTNLEMFVATNVTLTGTIPSEIGLLTKLRWLSVTSNKLTGTLPSEVATLESLEDCSVGFGNELVGDLGKCS